MLKKLCFFMMLSMGMAFASPKLTPTNFTPKPLPPDTLAALSELPGYTGLVVETGGFPVSRSTSPHIYDEDGRLIFGLIPDKTGAVKGQNVDLAMRIGVAGYDYKISDALKDKRVGPHPLVVHIVNINAAPGNWFPKDVVVSKEDGNRILAADEKEQFLKNFKVIFVVDPANL